LLTPGNDLPELLWQREYADAAAPGREDVRFTALDVGAEQIETSAWTVEDAR
jgi:hypothetical protein